ncbi:MAG: alpha-1,2-fucosyltransferase [Steroidobacteraceae bacterium]
MQQVIVQLFNGLGNQLFQYAAGRSLARRLGASLRLVHAAPRPSQPESYRPLLLQHFGIREHIGSMTSLDRLVVSVKPRFRLPSQIVRSTMGIQLLRQDPNDVSDMFDFDVDPRARLIYLSGYYQEYALVRHVEASLRRDLVLLQPLQGRSQQYADRIRAARRPVSIHLRHGDYMSTFGPNGLLPMSYYERALEHMMDMFGDSSFFIFSDDIPFARYWARGNSRMTVVDCNDANVAHECMRLMALCRHHIIANSTFSWWGAWLNQVADKQVIAPDRWLGVDTAQMPVMCPEWQLLPAYRPVDHSEQVARFIRSA